MFCFFSSKGVMLSWACAEDNGTIYINENGVLCCQSGRHRDKIVNWRFDCGYRGAGSPHNLEQYGVPDFGLFSYAMSMAVAHTSEAGADWVKSVVDALCEQFGRQ